MGMLYKNAHGGRSECLFSLGGNADVRQTLRLLTLKFFRFHYIFCFCLQVHAGAFAFTVGFSAMSFRLLA